MFETEPVIWLQSFASGWLTALLAFISAAGERRAYFVLVLMVTFGLNLRIGFALFQMILWNGVFTDFLKDLFALPRPAEVDSTVQLLGRDTINATPFKEMDGDHFFDLPEPEVIEYYRSHSDVGYGLPSGHVSMATTFWMGGAVWLRSRALGVLGAAFVLLMALSRMYLGRHFLADVLGGLVLGLLVVVAVHTLLRSQAAKPLFISGVNPESWYPQQVGFLALVLVVIPLILLFLVPSSAMDSAGRLLGTNAAFAVLFLQGLPVERNSPRYRVACVALALLLYLATAEAIEEFAGWVNYSETAWEQFLSGAVPPVACLLGTVKIGLFLRFYEPRNAVAGVG